MWLPIVRARAPTRSAPTHICKPTYTTLDSLAYPYRNYLIQAPIATIQVMDTFKTIFRDIAFTVLILASLNSIAEESLPAVEIIAVEDFAQLTSQAKQQKKLIMLEVAAAYCSYCQTLEEEIIKPMLRSGDYDADVFIRKIDIESFSRIKDINGKSVTAAQLAKNWGVEVTPTLIFLNGQNEEVSERIVGVNSLDYFGGLVDDAIELGLATIR